MATGADTLADTTESGCRGLASERPRLSPWDLEFESLPSEADPLDFAAGLASVRLRLIPSALATGADLADSTVSGLASVRLSPTVTLESAAASEADPLDLAVGLASVKLELSHGEKIH